MAKKVKLELVGLDSNAFAIMGAFSREARRQGWTKDEIDTVLNKATSGDYNNLLCTIMENTESPDDVEDDEDEIDDLDLYLDDDCDDDCENCGGCD